MNTVPDFWDQLYDLCEKWGFVQLGFSTSSWQKVQLNIDLFLDTQKYLYSQRTLINSWLKDMFYLNGESLGNLDGEFVLGFLH